MKKIFDNNLGYVKVLDHIGTDDFIAETSRVTTGSEGKNNPRLLNYLMRHKHETPFEFGAITFEIKCPFFIARQWFRHRIGSYAEKSRRYTSGKTEYYLPDVNRLPNKKGRNLIEIYNESLEADYDRMIEDAVPNELARCILPQSALTTFRWHVNLRTLFNFLKLRLDEHAQWEIREFAKAIHEFVGDLFPASTKAFNKYVLYSVQFNIEEMEILKWLLVKHGNAIMSDAYIRKEIEENLDCGLVEGELNEFIKKYKKFIG